MKEGDPYTCARCRGEFTTAWDDTEAAKEYEGNFPSAVKVGLPFDIICDDCYNAFMAWYNRKQPEPQPEKPCPTPQ